MIRDAPGRFALPGENSLAKYRASFADQLSNPATRERLLSIAHAEVGGQGPQAQQAFLETILNRAAARNQTLDQTLSGSYFPAVTYQRAARGLNDQQRLQYDPILKDVMGGSNVANYATGNASGTVGFAGGPQTSAYNGERFGIEGPDRKWAEAMAGGKPIPYAPSNTPAPQVASSGGLPAYSGVQEAGSVPAEAPAAPKPNPFGTDGMLGQPSAPQQQEQPQQAQPQLQQAALAQSPFVAQAKLLDAPEIKFPTPLAMQAARIAAMRNGGGMG